MTLVYYQGANESTPCGRAAWTQSCEYSRDPVWSEPIFACAGKGLGRGGAPYTDARKSAVTDGLTKAASMTGVGHEVFKGLVRTNSRDTGPSATTFSKLYNEQAKPSRVSLEIAKGLASNGDWSQACSKLRALIAEAKYLTTLHAEARIPSTGRGPFRVCAAMGSQSTLSVHDAVVILPREQH